MKKRVPKGWWTVKEHCIEEASNYTGRTAFQKGSPGAWRSAQLHGWLDEVCSHMSLDLRYENQHTYEDCEVAARDCTGKWDFKKKHRPEYEKAYHIGWYDEIAQKMYEEGIWQMPFRWDRPSAMAEAKKFHHREEFFKGSCGAYLYAQRRGFLEEACEHMELVGSQEWRKIYVFEFDDGYAYVGLTYNIKIRTNDHLFHNSPVCEHIRSTHSGYVFKELTGFMPKEEARKVERKTIKEYRKAGWNMLNTRKGGELGGGRSRTKEECQAEALKYKHRSDFLKKSSAYYTYARFHGWLDEICSHMDYINTPCSRNEAELAAKPFTSRKEFRMNNRRCYDYACKNNFIDEICVHMKPKHIKPSINELKQQVVGYNSLKDLRERNKKLYNYLRKRRVLELVCEKLEKECPMTKEHVLEIAKGYYYKGDFFKGAAKEYGFAKRHGFFEEATAHMSKTKKPFSTIHTKEKLKALVKECPDSIVFKERFFHEYKAIMSKGWFEELFGLPKPGIETHTKEKMKVLVRQIPNPFVFRGKYMREYKAILRKGWFEELFGRPIPSISEWRKWEQSNKKDKNIQS